MEELKKLTLRSKKELLKNESESYKSWLAKNGADESFALGEALAEATTERALGGAGYGALGEGLAADGLTRSGYRSYLDGQNEKRGLAGIRQAEEAGYIAKSKNSLGYKKYLSDYDELQRRASESVIKMIKEKKIFSMEKAYNYALGAGLNEENAYHTAAAARREAVEDAINEVVDYAVRNNIYSFNARYYARSLGLDEKSADTVASRVYALTREEEQLFDELKGTDYLAYLKEKLKHEKSKLSENE